jgi:hypothetical protein
MGRGDFGRPRYTGKTGGEVVNVPFTAGGIRGRGRGGRYAASDANR